MSFMTFIYLVASVFYIYIGTFSLLYDSKNRLNRIFFILCINLFLWSLMLTLMNAVNEIAAAIAFRRSAALFLSFIYSLMLHFYLTLAKKDKWLKKPWLVVLIYIPAILSVYFYHIYSPATSENMVRTPLGWTFVIGLDNMTLLRLYMPVYYISYMILCICLTWMWGRRSRMKREKVQAKIIIATNIGVLIFGTITDYILPGIGIPLVPTLGVTFNIIPVYGIWYSIKRYRLMNLSPQNVVLDVMNTMNEGLIITGRDQNIRDMNDGALTMLGYNYDELRDKPIQSVFLNDSDYKQFAENNKNELLLKKKNNEELPVLFSSTTLVDEWNEPYGSVMIFKDLTDIKNIQKQLQQSYDELEQKVQERTKELNEANQELKNEIKSRIEMEKRITRLAYYDQLTGLPNKELFTEYLNKKIQENLRNEITLAVLCLDLDSFKLINDTMGYAQGEALLRQVAERLKVTLRNSDTIARTALDQYLIIIQNNPDQDNIKVVADKILDAMRKPFELSGNDVHITASIGISVFPTDGSDAETLVKNADIAMCKAKERGKNRYEICNPEMKTSLVETVKLTNQLYRAVGKKEFELHYQPQVNINTGKIMGFEALVRWNHPELGIIPPGRFISIGEKTGLIIPIGEWVLETACRQMKEWQNMGIVSVPIAVNLSARQFDDYDIVGTVASILERTGLEPKYLELEITESILMEDTDSISKALNSLSQMGIRISIDDFGTEYSSLNYLKQLPIHRVKIDMNFVQGITINHKDEIIIKTIIALAKNLGIDILAEGVETFPQMEFLRNANCNVIQGFYLYKPMPAKRIEELLSK